MVNPGRPGSRGYSWGSASRVAITRMQVLIPRGREGGATCRPGTWTSCATGSTRYRAKVARATTTRPTFPSGASYDRCNRTRAHPRAAPRAGCHFRGAGGDDARAPAGHVALRLVPRRALLRVMRQAAGLGLRGPAPAVDRIARGVAGDRRGFAGRAWAGGARRAPPCRVAGESA